MGIYLDYQATSPMPEAVREVYAEALAMVGNPSSIHRRGQQARAALEDARERIARLLDCEPIEVVFTSGGTEAINAALKGAVWSARLAQPGRATRVASSPAEHHATLDALDWLERVEGTTRVSLALDSEGVIDLDSYREDLAGGGLTLVTTLLANNEIGSIQPVAQMAQIARGHSTPIHVDAIAALGYIPVSFRDLGVAAMSVSAHKVGGPVGVGALVLSRTAPGWEALHHGGDQQRGRSGTLDSAGAIAFAAALELREQQRTTRLEHLVGLRERLMAGIVEAIPDAVIRGSRENRLPGNVHATIPGCDGEVLLFLLDERGIQVSTGSACQAGVPEPSHVVLSLGVDEREARGALRLSLSYDTSVDDVDAVIRALAEVHPAARAAGVAGG